MRRLLLASRRGPAAEGAGELIEALEALGASVQVVACDVAEREQVQALLEGIDARHPLSAVVHAAGVLDDGLIGSLTEARLLGVLAPKVAGAWHLHELTEQLDLRAFVLFSSVAATFGGTGQAAYAAGNAFLDALASYRRANGFVGSSLGWGPWTGVGMVEQLGENEREQMARAGIRALSPEQGLALLDAAWELDETLLLPVGLDVGRLRSTAGEGRLPALLEELVRAPASGRRRSAGAARGSLARRLAGLDRHERERLAIELVREHAAGVLGHASAEAVDAGSAFKELGFDSLASVELRNRLSAESGLHLPATLVFDYPTPTALAEHLVGEALGERATVRLPARVSASLGEPIAVVGMSCRLPGGVRSPEELWELLAAGRDAIDGFPTDRGWDLERLSDPGAQSPGGSYACEGGFLEGVGEFDAAFFAISPREALAMDPQQRLLLEICWEAIEGAGIDPATLKGTATGVFAGISPSGYGTGLAEDGREDGVDGYLLTGNTTSVASGRVAYTFGLEGPAVSIDTACSSSLVALHLAAGALRQGECSLALAGGVNVMATPGLFVEFSHQRGLAPDGRCKSFADGADGTSWSEGAGILLLERLSDAQRAGRQILGVLRGSAVNQDGASNGLTAPNGPSQQRVIMQALASAGLEPGEVDAVEAHGTGTTLGDPIEAQALLATYGQDRREGSPLWLGSIKSNIGHAAAAAGVAGVIKMLMALSHGVLPRTLHVERPSAQVDWDAGAVELLTEERLWERTDRPRRAGISSFGLSGTNAHLILEEAPASEPAPVPDPTAAPALDLTGSIPWLLSARGAERLGAQAERLQRFLVGSAELEAADVALSLSARAELENRAVVLGASREELLGGLGALAGGEPASNVVRGSAVATDGGVVFLFPGQGSQWEGMAVELLGRSTVFAREIARCGDALEPFVGWRVEDVLRGERGAPGLERVDVVQPVLFAVMVSLAGLWRALGVRPDVVVGHSQGEIAAACVAGGLSLHDAARVIALRSRALAGLSGGGGMVSVALGAGELEASLERFGERVALAAVNGPGSVVVSGDPDALAELLAQFQASGVRARRIAVDYAAHSAQVEAVREQLLEGCAGIAPRAGEVPFYSTVTAGLLDTAALDAEYWYRNLRETVQFEQATETLLAAGRRIFIEISPHPVLTVGIQESIEQASAAERDDDAPGRDWQGVVAIGSLRRDEGGPERFLASVAQAWAHGASVDWQAALERSAARRVALPSYAFRRRRYWLAAEPVEREVGERWRYRVRWAPLSENSAVALAGVWLVVVPAGQAEHELLAGVVDALGAGGARPLVVEVDGALAVERETLAERLRTVLAEGGVSREDDEDGVVVGGVLLLLASSEGREPAPGEGGEGEHREPAAGMWGEAARLLVLTQALGDMGCNAPQWCVTRGAVSIGATDPLASPARGSVWGLGRVVGLEEPRRWGGLVDLPAEPDERTFERLCGVLAGLDGEDEVAVRAEGAFARRLTRALGAGRRAAVAYRPRGTVLVTGGTGALGANVARWLAENGAEHLLLSSRRGADAPGAEQLTGELERLGARVSVVACDVADRQQLQSTLGLVPAEYPLSAVFHVAGVVDDDAIGELSVEHLEEMLAGKADGAWHLHELTAGLGLEAFVLFSSIAGTLGSGGQGAYSAANAFLDALAEFRHGRGLVATSVAWGAWAGEGMAARGDEFLGRRGIRAMAPELAVAALGSALDTGERCVMVADLDWERYAPTYSSARARPLIGELPEVQRALQESGAGAGGGLLAERLASVSAGERERVVLELVRSHVASVLGHTSAQEVPVRQAFKELGFDSLTAVQLSRELQAATGLRLPSTVVFDYPSAAELAAHMLREALGVRTAVTVAAPGAVGVGEPVAIVGMSCRYPGLAGAVRSAGELWELIADGGDAIGGFPVNRGWDLEGLYDPDPEREGTSYAREGGFLHDAGEFDAAFFGVSPREALAMDPQQRLFLEVCWETLEDAGIDPTSLRSTQTGVFAGVGSSGYGVGAATASLAGYRLTGSVGSVVSGRVSYTLGLEGPAVSVDTACSSSLVAVHLACGALRAGECTLALAGGVAVLASPDAFVEFARQRGLAPDGRCKSYSDDADGTGWSEGAGVLLLERLSDARRNGHRVLGVVRGSAVNQDGASNGLTAPNGPSQQRVIMQALASAGLEPGEVDAVEGHGTGTTLGDPIEAQALLATYGRDRPAKAPLWLGSIKSNIGHATSAAGVAGVIKMAMALRHGLLPRTLHAERPSSQVDWSSGAVALLTEERPWQRNGRPRRAGISSFGVSGTNAHLILEEAPQEDSVPIPSLGVDGTAGSALPGDLAREPGSGLTPAGPLPWVLSGRGGGGLQAQAERLRHFLLGAPELDAADIALSLTTRAALEQRAVLLGGDSEELLAELAALAGGKGTGKVLRGTAAEGRTAFMFTGQGAQRIGMGRELYEAFPVFRKAFDEVCAHMDRHLGCSLRDVVFGGGDPLRRASRDSLRRRTVGLCWTIRR